MMIAKRRYQSYHTDKSKSGQKCTQLADELSTNGHRVNEAATGGGRGFRLRVDRNKGRKVRVMHLVHFPCLYWHSLCGWKIAWRACGSMRAFIPSRVFPSCSYYFAKKAISSSVISVYVSVSCSPAKTQVRHLSRPVHGLSGWRIPALWLPGHARFRSTCLRRTCRSRRFTAFPFDTFMT